MIHEETALYTELIHLVVSQSYGVIQRFSLLEPLLVAMSHVDVSLQVTLLPLNWLPSRLAKQSLGSTTTSVAV